MLQGSNIIKREHVNELEEMITKAFLDNSTEARRQKKPKTKEWFTEEHHSMRREMSELSLFQNTGDKNDAVGIYSLLQSILFSVAPTIDPFEPRIKCMKQAKSLNTNSKQKGFSALYGVFRKYDVEYSCKHEGVSRILSQSVFISSKAGTFTSAHARRIPSSPY